MKTTSTDEQPWAHFATTQFLINKVRPKDGLQSTKRIMPLNNKIAWIQAIAVVGTTEIEIESFISPSLLPLMADTTNVVENMRVRRNLTVVALLFNLKSAQNAIQAGTWIRSRFGILN